MICDLHIISDHLSPSVMAWHRLGMAKGLIVLKLVKYYAVGAHFYDGVGDTETYCNDFDQDHYPETY